MRGMQMADRKEWIEFEATVTLKGEYEVSDGVVTVRCVFGEDSTGQGGLPPAHAAETLLSGMARNPASANVPYWRRIAGR